MAESLITVFVNAFKNAVRKGEEDKLATEKELARSSGGSLGSTPIFRPAPEPDTGQVVDTGGVSVAEPDVAGEPGFTSSDPEEGGERQRT